LHIQSLVQHHGNASAKYCIQLREGWTATMMAKFYIQRIGPDVLNIATRPPWASGWYSINYLIPADKVVQIKPPEEGSEREYFLHVQCERVLKWMLPLQEYIDRTIADMGLNERDLLDLDIGAFVDKHEKALPKELYDYAHIIEQRRREEEG
jgi:hypothetical protein